MRKYIILFFSVFPFLFACNGRGSSGDIIPPEQMTAVLTAVHMADGKLMNISQAPDSLYKYGTARYLDIFKRYGVDSAQFRQSYRYYSTQPDKFADIYDNVLKSLRAKNDSISKLLTKQNLLRNKQMQKPVITNPNGHYGVGLQPQVAQPTRAPSLPAAQPTTYGRIKAIQDSIKKAHLQKRHAIPAK
jgi:hypothetical protein